MTKQEIAREAVRLLKEQYPDAACSLVYSKPYELMIAVRLSAQCTDARVNIVTKELFKTYPTLESFANADLAELETAVRPCGYYRSKAQNIRDAANVLLTQYGGKIPDTMEELLKIPGIGRKTANLLLGDLYKKPAVVADTHFIRITGRLGLTDSTDPVKVERDLRPLLPPEESSDFCHRVVLFGREICEARKPKCASCPLAGFCPGKMAIT